MKTDGEFPAHFRESEVQMRSERTRAIWSGPQACLENDRAEMAKKSLRGRLPPNFAEVQEQATSCVNLPETIFQCFYSDSQ